MMQFGCKKAINKNIKQIKGNKTEHNLRSITEQYNSKLCFKFAIFMTHFLINSTQNFENGIQNSTAF